MAGTPQGGEKVRLERFPGVTRKMLHSFVNRNVNDDAEAIYTDEWKGYIAIQSDNTRHDTVNHSEEEWVVGNLHNNGIEGEGSLL